MIVFDAPKSNFEVVSVFSLEYWRRGLWQRDTLGNSSVGFSLGSCEGG